MADFHRLSVKVPTDSYRRVSKKCQVKLSPEKLSLSGNFTKHHKYFDIAIPQRRASLRQDILHTVLKRTKTMKSQQNTLNLSLEDNPIYEDPRDVISEKPSKPSRKRTIQGIAVTSSPRNIKDGKNLLKEQKRKLAKKYEGLIMTLMDRCEENVVSLSEKDTHISKLKEKLQTVLEYNKLFAEENDQLKSQYTSLVKYVEECKKVIKEERDRNIELETKVKQFELPDREHSDPSTIPLVEVCMSCSSRQIILNQAREQNSRLQREMQALKDVLYRLNVQLSRYQEKLRTNVQKLADDGKGDSMYKASDRYDALDSLITASLGYKGQDAAPTEDARSNKSGGDNQSHSGRVIDVSGLLSAQALAPLFAAYQENLQEKETLILDYEKQFENMNKKSKQIVMENKTLSDKVALLEQELAEMRKNHKKLLIENETADIEKATLLERTEKAETKLKEVYEMYEDKIAAMVRDYETIHREYFSVKTALESSAGKVAQLDAARARTVPADLHERRLDDCKRLLEELKHQYSMDSERKTDQINKMQEQLQNVEEKYSKLSEEHEAVKEELRTALRNVRLYRKAAVVFRQRVKLATARMNRVRRSARRTKHSVEPLKNALDKLETIKHEIKVVKSRAYTSLEELERRILDQERRAALAQTEYRRELERATLALEHKEGLIRSLIDKVADVEEVRLSQTNAHRLQGIVSDSSPERSPSPAGHAAEVRAKVKLVPGPGGYFQEKDFKRKGQK